MIGQLCRQPGNNGYCCQTFFSNSSFSTTLPPFFDKQQQDVCDLGSKGHRASLAGEDAAGRVQTESPKLIAAPPLPDSYDALLQHQADRVERTDSLVSNTQMMAAAPVPPSSFQVSTERGG